MVDGLKNFKPLHIEDGDLLYPIEISGNRYSFERMKFSEIEVMPYPDEGADTDWFPENLQQVLCFQPISSTTKILSLKDSEGQSIKLNYEDIYNQPSGFITSSRTIVPQVLCPWNYGVNEIVLESKAKAKDGESSLRDKSISENICLWRLQDPKLKEGVTGFNADICHHAHKSPCGTSNRSNIVMMVGPKNEYDDLETGAFDREFISDLPEAGFYAFNIDFFVKNTLSKADAKDSPYAEITISDIPSQDEEEAKYTSSYSDFVSIRISPSAETKVSINNISSSSGSISFDDQGFKVPFSVRNGKSNILFIYSLLNKMILTGEFSTDPDSPAREVKCSKSPDLDLSEIASPSFDKFPEKHKKGMANSIFLNKQDAYVFFGKQIKIHWHNCYGSFGLIPIRYCPVVKFSYFFRISGQKDFSRGDGAAFDSSEQYDYFGLEYGTRYAEKEDLVGQMDFDSQWKNLRSLSYPKKISYNAKKQSTLYRADFTIRAKDASRLQKFPFEIFSLIHISKRSGKLTDILNNDGDFSRDFSRNVDKSKYNNYVKNSDLHLSDSKNNWMKFITSISISHNLSGSSGSISLDKQMMMDLGVRPEQAIGALTLVAKNGFYNEDGTTINDVRYNYGSNDPYPNIEWGQIFRGYAMEIQDNLGEGSSSLSIRLEGIQKKLSDMVLVNCPFWDGDDVFGGADAVMSYMKSYSGCDLRYVREFSNGLSQEDIFLPRSAEWQRPFVNFVMGTTVMDALNSIGIYINHRFVIQPDGRGYYYWLDETGKPSWINHSPIRMSYDSHDIISINISPHIENRYNTFLTLGLLGEYNPNKGRMDVVDANPGYKFSQKSIEPGDYPWSKIITNRENGIVTINELEERHRTNERFAKATIYEGSITVPGFHKFYLFDKISVCGVKYYIIGINHSISLQNKEWTTSLQIGKYIDKS